jgi:hypothetical protein
MDEYGLSRSKARQLLSNAGWKPDGKRAPDRKHWSRVRERRQTRIVPLASSFWPGVATGLAIDVGVWKSIEKTRAAIEAAYQECNRLNQLHRRF